MNNFIDRQELITKIKDGEFDPANLSLWLAWAMGKYATELMDLILEQPNFVLDKRHIRANQIYYLYHFNDIERFEYFVDKIDWRSNNGWGGGNPEYRLMKDICWYNRADFLKLIIDIPELDFSRNENIIIRHSYQNKSYEIVSMLLTRPEIKKDEKIYNKYSYILRSRKIKQLENKIYTGK